MILDQSNKIKLAESWANVQVTPCTGKGRTTTMEPTTMEPTTMEPTTMEPTTMQLTTMELTTTELTTIELASTTNTSTTSTNKPLTSTDMMTTSTTEPPAKTDNTTETGRKRRAAAVSPEMEDKFYCQVFYYPNDDSPKLKIDSTSTLDFSCTQEPDSDCLDGSAVNKTVRKNNIMP